MLRDLCRYRVTKERDQLREDSLRAVRPAISGSRCIRRYTGGEFLRIGHERPPVMDGCISHGRPIYDY
jgi:hypothetical protein